MKKSHESQEDKDSSAEKEPPNLIVGRDGENHWVVIETHGLCGGLFADEAAALRYARQQSRGYPGAVRIMRDLLPLNITVISKPRRPARR